MKKSIKVTLSVLLCFISWITKANYEKTLVSAKGITVYYSLSQVDGSLCTYTGTDGSTEDVPVYRYKCTIRFAITTGHAMLVHGWLNFISHGPDVREGALSPSTCDKTVSVLDNDAGFTFNNLVAPGATYTGYIWTRIQNEDPAYNFSYVGEPETSSNKQPSTGTTTTTSHSNNNQVLNLENDVVEPNTIQPSTTNPLPQHTTATNNSHTAVSKQTTQQQATAHQQALLEQQKQEQAKKQELEAQQKLALQKQEEEAEKQRQAQQQLALKKQQEEEQQRKAQLQAYQQQANSYLNAANNTTDPIQKSYDQGMAGINAAAAGNTNQLKQIQQIEQQQQQANNQAIVQETGDFLNALGTLIDQSTNRKSEEEIRKNAYMEELKNSGNPSDMLKVAIKYDLANDYVSANQYFKQAADMGSIVGMKKLALNYYLGRGVDKNKEMREKWLITAFYTAQKNIEAQEANPYFNGYKYSALNTGYPEDLQGLTMNACVNSIGHEYEVDLLLSLASDLGGCVWEYQKDSKILRMMELYCLLWLDKKYVDTTDKIIPYKDYKLYNSEPFVFDKIVQIEIRLADFYSGRGDENKTEQENQQQAIFFYKKTIDMTNQYYKSFYNMQAFSFSNFLTTQISLAKLYARLGDAENMHQAVALYDKTISWAPLYRKAGKDKTSYNKYYYHKDRFNTWLKERAALVSKLNSEVTK